MECNWVNAAQVKLFTQAIIFTSKGFPSFWAFPNYPARRGFSRTTGVRINPDEMIDQSSRRLLGDFRSIFRPGRRPLLDWEAGDKETDHELVNEGKSERAI